MERWILAVCDDVVVLDNLQHEWLKEGILIHTVSGFPDMVQKLFQKNLYLLIVIFIVDQDCLSLLKVIRELTDVPTLILSREYNSVKKTITIEAGADEYIKWTDSYLEETLASGRALIRRYTKLNREAELRPLNVLCYKDLLINMNYHKVYVNFQEIVFSRHEFDLLYLLASNPGQIFTKEQLYRNVWGDDYIRDADSGLHSCLNRIRRKLEEVSAKSNYIENVRGVGYRFIQDTL